MLLGRLKSSVSQSNLATDAQSSSASSKSKLKKKRPVPAKLELDKQRSVPNLNQNKSATTTISLPPTPTSPLFAECSPVKSKYSLVHEAESVTRAATEPISPTTIRATSLTPPRRRLPHPTLDTSCFPLKAPKGLESPKRSTAEPPTPPPTSPPPPPLPATPSKPSTKSSLPPSQMSRPLTRASTSTDAIRPPSRRLKKKPTTSNTLPYPSNDDTSLSPLLALKRRLSYTPLSTPRGSEESRSTWGDSLLNEEEWKKFSIIATRIPDFSSTQDSSKNVSVTIVDSLPHQKAVSKPKYEIMRNRARNSVLTPPQSEVSSRRTSESVRDVITEELNDEYLLDQDEVMEYLRNNLSIPAPLDSPASTATEGSMGTVNSGTDTVSTFLSSLSNGPRTPSPTAARHEVDLASNKEFMGLVATEFPYLFADVDDLFHTPPLAVSRQLANLTPTSDGTPTAKTFPKIVGTTELPPSPPLSEGRLSSDHQIALLEELASESESMRSVVDAINRASSFRSSFAGDFEDSPTSLNNTTFDDDDEDGNSIYEDVLEHPYYEPSLISLRQSDNTSSIPADFPTPRPWTRDSDTISTGDDSSIYSFAAPILKTGHPSMIPHPSPTPLSRSLSLASHTTVQEDLENTPLKNVLAERRGKKPVLSPLVIAPIVAGQYGPPLQRRGHLRGKTPGKGGSMKSVKSCGSVKVKVVEQEVVEYTPVDEKMEGEGGNAGGWMRQRRVSRGGRWVVVEREILSAGAI